MSDKLFIVSIINTIGEKFYFRSNKIVPGMNKDLSKFWKKDISRGTMFANQSYLSTVINTQLEYAYTKDAVPNIGKLSLSSLTIEIFELSSSQKVFRTEDEVVSDFMNNQLPKLMQELNALKIELEK